MAVFSAGNHYLRAGKETGKAGWRSRNKNPESARL